MLPYCTRTLEELADVTAYKVDCLAGTRSASRARQFLHSMDISEPDSEQWWSAYNQIDGMFYATNEEVFRRE